VMPEVVGQLDEGWLQLVRLADIDVETETPDFPPRS